MTRLALSTAVFCLSLTSCVQSDTSKAEDIPNPISGMGMISYSYSDETEGLSPEERLAWLRSRPKHILVLAEATEGLSANDWADADARLARAVRQFDGRDREIAQQIASTAMLRVWLPAADDSPDVRKAYARHALTMAREASLETALIASAIDSAGDALSADERLEAARLGAQAARDRLRRRAACDGPGCDGPSTIRIPDNAMPERNARALNRLEAMVAAGS